ncbi:MAG: D-beta-D-heptose 7-phosphate kinase / D-beta-D-heptose 1-phosphate adenosyltransferase [Desulfobacteraceae bacterium Eth-SRB1]|nr:MAG: D-beta-D-heptose 7-phosphate kinase / D-beta-D-heptose 1-phosphate adenosyltransferase [Desulfobacteraceae bacterium Eth-SRB1]
MPVTVDISKFNQSRLLVVGDVMVDEYLWGEVDRISPEAPVQIVSIKNEVFTLGGAGNVANNIVSLGANVSVAGVIGTDRCGNVLLEKFKELGVDTEGIIQVPDRPTTRKTRVVANNQQVLRIDRETKQNISKNTMELLIKYIDNKIPLVDAVLISDYGKGLITDKLIKKIISSAKKHNKTTIADPKGLSFSKYSGISLLTPNKKEASLASGVDIINRSSLVKAGTNILNTIDIDNLLITCGKEGMVLFERNKEPCTINARAKQVFDVSGAGDTVAAVFGLAIASGASFADSAVIANAAAGIVVGKLGTATISQKELLFALKPYPDDIIFKHKNLSELPVLIQELRKNGKRIVLTNGCFDILHTGHIMLFSASKQFGDILIVAIDDDDSVKKLKGRGRPVLSANERVKILSALDSVDYVVVFSSDKLNGLINIIRPDVLTKGSNYSSNRVVGHETVEQFGGKTVIIPIIEKISSSIIINNIKHS